MDELISARTENLWDALAERVEAFVAAWQGGVAPPDLAGFVPAEPAGLRRLALVELVKVDLEMRQTRGHDARRVEQYLADWPELAAEGGPPCDLVYEEYHVRRSAGEMVETAEYLSRFPALREPLARFFHLGASTVSTSLCADQPPKIDIGEQVDDFEILARLGEGAFASVFLARQRSMQRLVALKVSADRGNESQTLAQLDHPHIVRIYDQRLAPQRRAKLLYMQYVPGGTLAEAMASMGPAAKRTGRSLTAAVEKSLAGRGESTPADVAAREVLSRVSWRETVCRLGIDLAEALDYAHSRGVLHRDLKPANILLAADATPKLVDFNISFCSKLDGATPAAYFGGSVAYMSPEQLEACNPQHARTPDKLRPASDVYSLGVILWELLTGSRPWGEERMTSSWPDTLDAMTRRRRAPLDPPALEKLKNAAGQPLAEVVLACLAADAERRMPTAGEAARQLRLCLKPEALALLRPPQAAWLRTIRRWPLPAMLIMALAPNALAAVFNFAYNREQIVARLDDSYTAFWNIQTAVNGIAFPLGIAWLVYLAWPLQKAMRAPPASAAEAWLRRRALRLGHIAAVVGTSLWFVAGLVYPAAMNALGVDLSPRDFAHFVSSLALCGLIAAVYPFFGITWLGVRLIYPALLAPLPDASSDAAELARLERRTWIYLALAGCLPMLGVAALVLLGGAASRLALTGLSIAGLAGFGVVFFLARRIQRDLESLRYVLAAGKAPQI